MGQVVEKVRQASLTDLFGSLQAHSGIRWPG